MGLVIGAGCGAEGGLRGSMAGVSQPSPLTPVLDRARSMIASGQFETALVLLERAVEIGREKLGEDDPDVLTAARELAGVHLRTDDPMAARRILEDAYAAGQWRLGDSDPVMLHISHDLGIVAQELGNKHEARKAFGRVLANGPAVLGEGHEFVVRARDHLGEEPSGATVRPEVTPTPTPPAPADHVPPNAGFDRPGAGPDVPVRLQPPHRPEPDSRVAMERSTEMLPITRPVDGHTQDQTFHRPGYEFPPQQQTGYPNQPHPQVGHPGQQAHAPQPAWPVSVPPMSPQPGGQPQARGGRAMAIGLTAVATLISALAVVALVVVLADRSQNNTTTEADPTATSTTPVLGGDPPTGVRLDDQGVAVNVTWRDPTGGRNGFMVTMARPGQQMRPVSQVGPGVTASNVEGLNPDLEYCFAVVAVYSTKKFASSKQVCTERR